MAKRALAKDVAPAISDELAFTELFRTPIICIPSEEVSEFAQYVGSSFPVLAVDAALLNEVRSQSEDRAFLSSPPCIVALLTSNRDQMNMLTELKVELERLNAPFVPSPSLVDVNDSSSIVGALADGVGIIITSQAKLISLQSRETAQLRQKNEQMQNQFHSLEAFLDRRGEQPCDAVFVSVPPADGAGQMSLRIVQGQSLGQLLPVASQGLCGFSLNIMSAGEGDCQLIIGLKTLEDGKTLGDWTVQGSSLRTGWNTFALSQSVVGLRRSVRLELSVVGSGKSPEIALGELQPVLRFQVLDLDGFQPTSDRNLALKLFAGLPGLLVPDWFSTSGKGIQGLCEIIVPTELLAAVRQTQFNKVVDYPEVVFLADERTILCHPPAVGTTVAEIPTVIPPGTVRVSMVAFLPSSNSKPVEYLLRATLEGREMSSPQVVESVWTKVEPEGAVVMNLFFKDPIASSASLELATRMLDEGNNSFAWAKFKDLVVVSQR